MITTVTPYRDRPEHLRAWLKALKNAHRPFVRHLLIDPGTTIGNKEKGYIESNYPVEIHQPPDLEHGIMSIGHWHNWAAEKLIDGGWMMKLDVDCLPHTEFFDALSQYIDQGQMNWFNIGFFRINREQSRRLSNIIDLNLYRELSAGLQPEASHFCIRLDKYLELGGCDSRFIGYGWEDYQQLYRMAEDEMGEDPLHGIVDIHNVTTRCRDEISRPLCRRTWSDDNRLALLHKWHGSSLDPRYKQHIQDNKKVLLNYILERKALCYEG